MWTAAIESVEAIGRPKDDDLRGKAPRLHVWCEDIPARIALANADIELHQLARGLLHDVAERLGLRNFDPARAEWSRKAGCSCGCSPGFVLFGTRHPEHGLNFDVHMSVSLAETFEDFGAGI